MGPDRPRPADGLRPPPDDPGVPPSGPSRATRCATSRRPRSTSPSASAWRSSPCAPPSSRAGRGSPLLRVRVTPVVAVALTATVVAGSMASTFTYVRTWHTDNPGRRLPGDGGAGGPRHGTSRAGRHPRPGRVMSPVLAPYNTVGALVPIHVTGVDFPPVSTDLHVLFRPGVPGPRQHRPVDDVGAWRGRGVWLARRRQRPHHPPAEAHPRLRLVAAHRLPGSQRTDITLTVGDVSRTTTINPGIGSLFLNARGSSTRSASPGSRPGTTLCIDVIEVGDPRARRELMTTVCPRAPPRWTSAPQFPVLDTLRAVGALAVLTTHTAFQTGEYLGNGVGGMLLARLDVGVAIFFVLSGFLLSRPYLARRALGLPAPALGTYYEKRVLRIFPCTSSPSWSPCCSSPANEGSGAARLALVAAPPRHLRRQVPALRPDPHVEPRRRGRVLPRAARC